MVIKVKLSEKGIRDAQDAIVKYQTELQSKAEKFVEALGQKGLSVAKVRFANAKYAGKNDVKCDIKTDGTKCTIIAEGDAVAFIEFGTGVTHSGWGASGTVGPIPLPDGIGEHGTYGQGKGNHKGWYYYGEAGNAGVPVDGKKGLCYTSGNDAAMAMWGAVEEMAAQVEATWREVWMND